MRQLSPRQAASALGVSESSLKRWSDQGLIAVTKTGGGHRKLSSEALVDFLRKSGRRPVQPELLGLPLGCRAPAPADQRTLSVFTETLAAGDLESCRAFLIDLHLTGWNACQLGDQFVRPAFQQLGERWSCGELQVYQERRACGICQQTLLELRQYIPEPSAAAPLAIGGNVDSYTLSGLCVDLVLRQVGYRTQQLGANLPFTTLTQAAETLRPRLFWLSISHVADAAEFLADYRRFFERAGRLTAVVVGGQALSPTLRADMDYAACCDELHHLEGFARALLTPTAGDGPVEADSAAE